MPIGKELGLSLEDVATSTYRAHCCARGKEANWEHLSIADQEWWVRLCARSEQILDRNEGNTFDAATDALLKSMFGDKTPAMDRLQALAWNATARHLATLIDAEEIPNLGELERSWGAWVQRKLTPTGVVS